MVSDETGFVMLLRGLVAGAKTLTSLDSNRTDEHKIVEIVTHKFESVSHSLASLCLV